LGTKPYSSTSQHGEELTGVNPAVPVHFLTFRFTTYRTDLTNITVPYTGYSSVHTA